MDKQFDELSKSLAEGVSRREAIRKFGIGLATVLLARVVLQNEALGQKQNKPCSSNSDCTGETQCCNGACVSLRDNNNCGYCGNVCHSGTTCGKVKVGYGEGGGFYYVIDCVAK